jgi:hypothetical protein
VGWEFGIELGMAIINGLRTQKSQFWSSALNQLLRWSKNRPLSFQFKI